MTGIRLLAGHSKRWPALVIVVFNTIISSMAYADDPPTGCTDISQIPITSDIEFIQGIQNNIFVQFSANPKVGCADCHTNGGQNPDLDPNDSADVSPYGNIVNVPSYDYPSLDYIVPNRPDLSLLFMKVNCDNPPVGSRMPLGYTDVFTPEQQALIYDWIAGGAMVEATNTIFRGTFDIRGFFVDEVFKGDFEP